MVAALVWAPWEEMPLASRCPEVVPIPVPALQQALAQELLLPEHNPAEPELEPVLAHNSLTHSLEWAAWVA